MKTTRAALGCAMALGLTIALTGCTSDAGDAEQTGNTAQTEVNGAPVNDDAPVSEETNSSDIVDDDGEIPGWLLDGFPLYPGSELAASGSSGGATMVSFSVPGSSAEEIYAWFVDAYSKDGWVASDLDDEHTSFDADNADGRVAYINVTSSTYVLSATPAG